MARKSFRVGQGPDVEPMVFEIEGTDVAGNPIPPASFRCVPALQGERLVEIVAAIDKGEAIAGLAVTDFIRQAIVDDDLERYDQIAHGKDVIIDLQTLGAIMMWLVEQYTSRPTVPPSASPNGHSPTSLGSTGALLSPEPPIPAPSP